MNAGADDDARTRRLERRLKLAIATGATSVVACTAMLAVTISVLRRAPPASRPEAAAPPPAAPAAPRVIVQVPQAPAPASPGATPVARRPMAPQPVPRLDKSGNAAATLSPATAALAAKLHIRPEVFVELVGPDGDLPKGVAERLTRADEAGRALAGRLGLDEVKTQAFGNLFTNHVFMLLREERQGAPADPARVAEIADDTLAGVRATAGDRAAEEASAEIAKL